MFESFAFSGSEFYTSYMDFLQKRLRPSAMVWSEEQLGLASEIAEGIDKIRESGVLNQTLKDDLVAAINKRDMGKVETILRWVERRTLAPPGTVPIIRIGIGLALNYCTPEIIRQSCSNLLGPSVMWD